MLAGELLGSEFGLVYGEEITTITTIERPKCVA